MLGGHTGEILTLVSALDFSRYRPRTYIVSEGDTLSEQKTVALERRKTGDGDGDGNENENENGDGDGDVYAVVKIPRARDVHQSWLSIPFTTLRSFWACVFVVTLSPLVESGFRGQQPFADLVVMNGPGTCVPLCAAVMLNKVCVPRFRVLQCWSSAASAVGRTASSQDDIHRNVCSCPHAFAFRKNPPPSGRPVCATPRWNVDI